MTKNLAINIEWDDNSTAIIDKPSVVHLDRLLVHRGFTKLTISLAGSRYNLSLNLLESLSSLTRFLRDANCNQLSIQLIVSGETIYFERDSGEVILEFFDYLKRERRKLRLSNSEALALHQSLRIAIIGFVEKSFGKSISYDTDAIQL